MAGKSLQAQIDATPSGGVLHLAPGEYREQVVIKRPMTLEGRGRSCWIGNEATPVVSIECGGVVLRNLMVEALSGPSMPAVVAKAGAAPLLDSVFLRGDAIGVPAANLRLQAEPLPAAPPPMEPSGGSSSGASDRISRRVEKLLDQAEQAEDAGELASAENLYEEALELQPSNLEAAKFLQVLQRKLSAAALAPLQGIPAPPGSRRIRVWDVDTLQAALRQGSAGDTIVLAPGIYRVGMVLDKDLFLEGEGSREQVVLEATDTPCVRSTAGGGLRRLTLRKKGPVVQQALVIERTLKVQDCDITSEGHVGIDVFGREAVPYVSHTTVRNCGSGGLWIHERGAGTFENCDVFGNKLSGVEVKEQGNPTFRGCKIHDQRENCGVNVWQSGAGTFENCDIFGNKLAGVEVKEQGRPTFRSCKIHDGERGGVVVYESGTGTFENCDVFGNKLSGVEVKELGNPTFRGCKIHDGEGGGVLVYQSGTGTFENCDIFGNKLAGAEVKEQGNPTFRGCKIHDGGGGGGVFVYESGAGTFENCDIFGNKLSGVEVKEQGNPAFRGCKIHDGEGGGVLVYQSGTGTFENCDIFGNKLAGAEVKEQGNPTFRGCKIHEGEGEGVFVHSAGAGTFESCDVFGNKLAGVEVRASGSPTVRGCVVRGNRGFGIWVADTGHGSFISCRCSGNAGDWRIDSTSVRGSGNQSSDRSVPRGIC